MFLPASALRVWRSFVAERGQGKGWDAVPANALLSLQGLTVRFCGLRRALTAVDDVSFTLLLGEILGIVGESGARKSTVAHALMRLIDPPGEIAAGTAWFEGRDLLKLPETQMRAIRGNRICMIFQDPVATLNPLMRIGEQIAEELMLHRGMSHREAMQRAVRAIDQAGIPAVAARARDYPHQLSGGMQQRCIIAAAVVMEPALIIADEPTTAPDATPSSRKSLTCWSS